MKKGIILLPMLLMFSSRVLADAGESHMMDVGMMGGTGGWMFGSLFGLFYLALASFVFSLIFWGTYKWLIKNKKGNK